MSLKYMPVTWSKLCLTFLMCVETMYHLNYSGQESKKNNVQFMILTYLWPWNKVWKMVWFAKPYKWL